MNEPVSNSMYLALSVLITITALAYTFWSMTDWNDSYDYLTSNTTVYIEDTQIPEEISWTGDQVVAKLYRLNMEGAPIIVDGRLFQTDLDVTNYQSSVSLQKQYTQSIEWDSTGKLYKIIFTSI